MKIIECVANISEGRDRGKIELMAEAVAGTRNGQLLNVSADPDHNRTVFTFIADPETIVAAALALCNMAITLIDLSRHEGVHPRIGAVDVVPFIPLGESTMAEAAETAHRFGRAFAQHNQIPVYFYGEAALNKNRRELPDIRRGGYEGLQMKLEDPAWAPDAGPCTFDPNRGAAAVGARFPLIAFNINLTTDDVHIARQIASEIREAAHGGLPRVRALGLFLKSRRIVQVSMNLLDYRVTPMSVVYETVRKKAKQHGVKILESELIGLIPEAAYRDAAAKDLKIADFGPHRVIEYYCNTSIDRPCKSC